MKRINRRLGAVLVAASSMLAIAGGASAQTTIGDPIAQQAGGGCNGLGRAGNTGQSFTVPAGVDSVRSISIGVTEIFGNSGEYRVSLRSGPGAAEIFGMNFPSSSQSMPDAVDVFSIPGVHPVSEGDILFISAVDVTSTNMICYTRGSYYSGGAMYASGSAQQVDTVFQVVFNDTPPPVTVPTMTEWAMILFGLILAGGAALMIQRRRFTV